MQSGAQKVIMANHMVGYGLFTETTIPDQGLGKMYFEKLGRRVSRGNGGGEVTKH